MFFFCSDTGVISVQSATCGRTSSQICKMESRGLLFFWITDYFFYLHVENGKIQINTANYGRTDKIICSEGRPSEQLQNTNCYSPNALAPVSKSCNGLESCEVFATHTVFTDPCFGIYKYLAISYFCLPPGVREYLLPDLLSSLYANYGRTDSSTCCTGRPASQLAKTDCYALNSQTVVTSGCEGKNSCSILASNSVFSDPCVGTFKYLYISYSCYAIITY
uniref:SUEL-type lectin domain-containing protein n=1 Tax=Sinocyclocheilus grahami TaxID=75366 RepID=A0A672KHF9_SINGR